MDKMGEIQRISFIRVYSRQELFQIALGELFSLDYLTKHQQQFGDQLFVFEVKLRDRPSWSLFKNSKEIELLFKDSSVRKHLKREARERLDQISFTSPEEQGSSYCITLHELCELWPQVLQLQFFEAGKEGLQSFKMLKRSGGRYKAANCCNFGDWFKSWQARKVTVYHKGIDYFNEQQQMREFLSFGQNFSFEAGRPNTGLEFGILLHANHRQLHLEAASTVDFVRFLFVLRHACHQSNYMSINRYNSFSPIQSGNKVRFLIDGEQYFTALADSLDKAKRSVLITGWMISPEFLLRRGQRQQSLLSVLNRLAHHGVKVSIMVYQESCLLNNGSQYAKCTLQSCHQNIRVLRHPCGRLPVLWSHHGKLVVIDEREAFVGGLDLCYGRFDNPLHQLFPPEGGYPGIEYTNPRVNDDFDVRSTNQASITRDNPRLPWHDVAQSIQGPVVGDLVHHFYQLWNFVRYENQLSPKQNMTPSLETVDTKTLFASHIKSEDKTVLKTIGNGIKKLKKKGKDVINDIQQKIVKIIKEEEEQIPSQIRVSVGSKQDYFSKYIEGVQLQIAKKNKVQDSIIESESQLSCDQEGPKRRRSSERMSAQQAKKLQMQMRSQVSQLGQQSHVHKTNSFLLTGDNLKQYINLQIDSDYVNMLERVKSKRTQQSQGLQSQIQEPSISHLSQVNYWQAAGNSHSPSTLSYGDDECQVLRSVGNWSIGCHPCNTELSIQIAYLQLISQAKHYLYIQNQFFISSTADSKNVHNEVANAIYHRIVKAIQQNQVFRVYILLPLIPGFAGNLDVDECLLLRKGMQWQYDTIYSCEQSLWKKLLQHTDDPSKYLKFLSLRTHGVNHEGQPKTQMVYIHTKLIIIDDETVLCGSANINDRSMMGDRDSELAVVSRGGDWVQGVMDGNKTAVCQSAMTLRLRLWKEHFDFEYEGMLDPVSDKIWDQIGKRAQINTLLYREIFGCYPDKLMTTRQEIKQVKRRSDLSQYDSKVSEIKGFVVEFPLAFLSEEPLSCFITEKEFYMPTQCLT